jgi:ATP-binding cassette subfamily A (ABC1) protein 3
LLGDRIAIMSNGKLQCMGSSMFLKNKFGVGYTLTIVKESQSKQQGDVLSSISQEIEKIVQKNIPAAEPLSNVGAEQSFRLPFSSSGQFSEMFRDLDLNKAALGIAEYGISVTTLEEVFLRVDRHDYSSEATRTEGLEPPSSSVVDFNTETEPTQVLREKSRDVYLDTSETYGLQGDEETAALTSAPGKAAIVGEEDDSNFVTFLKHFKALFQKRYIYGKRDKRMVFCQILLPFIVVVIGLSLLLIRPNTSQPNLVLSPVKYNPKMDMPLRNFVAFGVEENAQSPVGAEMERMFTGQQDEGVYGVAVPIGGSLEGVSDSFGGCSEGANVLYNMSQFLMQPQPGIHKYVYSNIRPNY